MLHIFRIGVASWCVGKLERRIRNQERLGFIIIIVVIVVVVIIIIINLEFDARFNGP